MSRFRDRDDFGATIDAAAVQLNIDATALEKDYWVTEVLRVLARDFPDDFVFKGGTSLSKCYRIIERFSEDIDILILHGERSRNAIHALMKNMANAAASALGAEPESVNSQTGVHRTVRLAYPTERQPIPGITSGVKLEMGIRGGAYPCDSLPATCMLADALRARRVGISEWEDLQPITVPVLHPGRTLLEKLAVVHTNLGSDPTEDSCRAYARHYYDIHQLLNDRRVLALLENRDEARRITASIQEVTNKHFITGPWQETKNFQIRPEGGWAASHAFDTGNTMLSDAYARMMEEFYFGAAPGPDFASVCSRIQEVAKLL